MTTSDEINKIEKIENFYNPISNSHPGNEAELSAVLALRFWKINWNYVPIRRVDSEINPSINLENFFSESGNLISEYPLDHKIKKEQNIWGAMRVDFVYVENGVRIIFMESKLGSKQTHDNDQFERYINYLDQKPNQDFKERWFILLCLKDHWEKEWYKKDMIELVPQVEVSQNSVSLGIVYWDDIVKNLRTPDKN